MSNKAQTSQQVKECFANVTTYKREHDEFDFEDQRKLEPSRLIIATNLAGRGTDIKLSEAVINAGGLHVIAGFMPKNCRIEEQAFGRAARFVCFIYISRAICKISFLILLEK